MSAEFARRSDPGTLWRQSDRLREKARLARAEAESLERAADRMAAFAAAIADGREGDIRKIAVEMARR